MELLEFLHLIDDDRPAGEFQGHSLGAWPEIDVRRAYFCSLVRRDPGPDPDACFAELYCRYVVHDAEVLPRFKGGTCDGQIDWQRAWYDVQDFLDVPVEDCPECGPGGTFTAGRHRHTMISGCPVYENWRGPHCPPNPFGEEFLLPADKYGTLTVCGSAWSVDDGPLYCKGCYREVDASWDRHEIYKLWEAPSLEHYAERIGRLL